MPMLDYAMRRTIAAQLQTRLLHNRELRHSLMADPKAVLAKEFDVQVPEDVRVSVVENTACHQYLPLPVQPEQIGEGNGIEDLVRQRAAQDENFRKQALADPKGALEGLLHFKLPAQMHITAVEETPHTWYIICPPLTDLLAEELDDQVLEAVAGGASAFGGRGVGPGGKVRNPSYHRPRYPVCH